MKTAANPFAKEDDPSFWTTQEAADDLRVSTQKIRALVRENKLPATPFGKGYRFVPADVREYAHSLANR